MKEQRFELSLSSNYLKHWKVYDALREIFQNAFDRAKDGEEHSWFYADATESMKHMTLTIGNNNTSLTRRSLLLGETTKENSKSSIGKFGEGYKLAMLVFLRNGIKPTIRTGDELWEFKLEYNADFEATMLVVYITKMSQNIDELTFTFSGLKKSTLNSYSQFNLLLQKDIKSIATNKGELLTDKRNKGKLFVGNLFVCEYKGDAMYGYNFKPGVFELGRDRSTIGGIDLTWETSKVILEATKKDMEIEANVAKSIASDKIKSTEGEYVHNFIDSFSKLKSKVWELFQTKNPSALPITDQDDYENVVAAHVAKPETAFVSHSLKAILTATEEHQELSDSLDKAEVVVRPSPYESVKELYENMSVDDEDYEAFEDLLEQSKEWEWKLKV